MPVAIAAFYKFVAIEDPAGLRERLLHELLSRQMRGTILVAHEGINGTISAAPHDMQAFLVWLRVDVRFADITTKDAVAPEHPFQRLKVKVKREIVTFGRPEADPTRAVGTYIEPRDWNTLLSDPDVVVVDTRNSYEIEAGTFAGAIDPNTRSFSEFPDYVQENLDPARHRKIAMFCTGGVRCEKASAYLKHLGFEEVYHLKGGILNYIALVPPEQSLWQGDCFVFDEREVAKPRQ